MNNYMFTVTRSSHCCAVYELAGLSPNVIESAFIDAIRDRAKEMGQPKVYPLLIQFSDKDGVNQHSKGEELCKLLITEGYKCDRFKLGLNPKSGHDVSLYHWWVHKGKGGISKVREYTYDKQEKQSAQDVEPTNGVSRAAQARRTRSSYRRRTGRFLRIGSRGRTGL